MKSLWRSLEHVLVIVLSIICQTRSRRDFTIEIMNSSMEIMAPDIVKTFTHRVYCGKVLYAEFSLYKEIADFTMKIEFNVITKNNRYTNLSKFEVNVCEALRTVQRVNFMRVIFRELLRVSNLPKKCPLVTNTVYKINNYTLRADDYPPFAPAMQCQIEAGIYVKDRRITSVNIHARIRKL